MKLTRRNYWHPNHEQELLLKAALLDGHPMHQTFNAWIKLVTIDQIDYGSYRLLPLLYHNLNKQGVNHPVISRIKKAYVETWAKNQITFRKVSPVLKAFHEANVDTLVLKGASLIINYYQDFGLRPMSDFDLLIKPHQTEKAIGLLQKLGWSSDNNLQDKSFSTFFCLHHALNFHIQNEYALDLHWHVLKMCLGTDADLDFWQDAIPIKIDDVETLCLNPSDDLFHTCIHGAEWNPMPPIRWIADALTILNSQVEIDWNRMVNHAKKHQLTLNLIDTIEYLISHFGAPFPHGLVDRLKAIPISKLEQKEYRILTKFPLISFYMPTVAHYPRIAKDTGLPSGFFGYLKYWQTLMGLDHLWQAPFSFIWTTFTRLIKIKL